MPDLKSNIWKYYAISLADFATIFLPFIVYFFQETLGFSLTQIGLIHIIYTITIFALEIPSGYFADIFGRKVSIILGLVLQIIAMIIFLYWGTFLGIAVAYAVLGIGLSLLSGADSALLYETLVSLKKEKRYKKYQGRVRAIAEVGVIAAALIGTVLIPYGFEWTVIATIIVHLIGTLIAFSLKEPEQKKHLGEELNFLDSIKEPFKQKKMRFIFFYSFLLFGLSNLVFIFYQPYFNAVGIEQNYYGLIFAGLSIPTFFAAFFAEDIEKRLGLRVSLILMPVMLALTFIFSSVFFVAFGVIFFVIRELVRGLSHTLVADYVNRHVNNPKRRATILSVQNMFARLGLSFFALVGGMIGDAYSLKTAYIIMGILTVVLLGPIIWQVWKVNR